MNLRSILCGLLTAGLLAGCSAPAASSGAASTSQQAVTLRVFAAASLTETLQQIAADYQTQHPQVQLEFTFDSSGTLKTQIEEGAVCDVFISAAQKQMDQLDGQVTDPAINPEGLDFINTDTRFDLVQNQVVLAVTEENPAQIYSFADLGTDKLYLLALGNEDVPVGAYSLQILTGLNLLEGLEQGQKISYGSNVKEVTTQVLEGAADCGMIYATDAFSAKLTVVDTADTALYSPAVYPAAALKASQYPQQAADFLNYLKTSPKARSAFEGVGFTMVE